MLVRRSAQAGDAEDGVVQDGVPLAGHFVDAVDVDGAEQVVFVDGEEIGLAVDLPRAGEYDL